MSVLFSLKFVHLLQAHPKGYQTRVIKEITPRKQYTFWNLTAVSIFKEIFILFFCIILP